MYRYSRMWLCKFTWANYPVYPILQPITREDWKTTPSKMLSSPVEGTRIKCTERQGGYKHKDYSIYISRNNGRKPVDELWEPRNFTLIIRNSNIFLTPRKSVIGLGCRLEFFPGRFSTPSLPSFFFSLAGAINICVLLRLLSTLYRPSQGLLDTTQQRAQE